MIMMASDVGAYQSGLLERARDALHAISPDLTRDEWVRVGMAAHAAGLQFEEFDAWSAGGGSYDARAASDTWRSFKDGKGLGPGTLFHMARQAGWNSGEKPVQARPAKATKRPAERTNGSRPSMSAPEIWERCEVATAAHPYIAAKQGTPDGLRVVPEGDGLRIAGQSVAGWLVVPVLPLGGGEPVSLQFIPPPRAGKKLNLPGASVDGVFTVGEVLPAGTCYLCEGIGQAWACWKATGAAAVGCFGWGRVRGVAAELRQRDASARLVLVPDVGKEAEAETIARDVAAQFVTMPADGWEANDDVNDLALRDGFDALEALLVASKSPAHRFRLLGSSDLQALPTQAWAVRNVLPQVGVAALYGPSGSGKSFLGFDLGVAIAEGAHWFGHRVKAAPVVYVALEGEAGFKLRAQAWEKSRGRPLPPWLRLVLQSFALPGDVKDLATAIRATVGAGAVVIVDTLNRAAPTADENSSRDMGEILEGVKELQRLTAGLVVLVHHTGKDTARGLRGHSSLFAALDAAVEVSRDGDRREWRVAKSKDGEDGASHPFRLEVVNLGNDSEGEPITSCVVVPDETPHAAIRSRLPKGGNQKVVLDALGELLRKSATFGRAGAPSVRPCVQLEPAVEAIAPRLTCDPKRQKERVRQALTGLSASGVVTCREGWLWLA